MNQTLFEWSVTTGLKRSDSDNAIAGTSEPLGAVRHIEDLTVDAVFLLKDFARHLSSDAVARKFREVAQKFSHTLSSMVVTSREVKIPPDLGHRVVHCPLALPDREELRQAIWPVIESLTTKQHVEFDLERDDVETLLGALSGMTLNQARQVVAYAALIDGTLAPADIDRVIERKAEVLRDGGLLEFFPVQDNRFELGGFDNLKEWLDRAQVGFSPEAAAINLQPPKGILFVGVQGCGKSLAARAIARRWRLPLLKLDAGRLFDKFIGESEKNFRRAVSIAESMAPTVLWIDEIEKAMPSTTDGAGDGGLSRRLFGAFLTWMQEKDRAVFVVATANDLGNMPPELLRKGRFDRIFFVDLPDAGQRKTIFDIHLRLRKQQPGSFDLDALADAATQFSGAEIEQAVVGALYRALHDGARLTTALLLKEISETIPLAVSRREDIERIRETARGRFVKV